MQPTTRPISPNKKVLVAIRFVFFIRWSSAVDSPIDQTHDGHSKQVCRCGDPLIQPTIPPTLPLRCSGGTTCISVRNSRRAPVCQRDNLASRRSPAIGGDAVAPLSRHLLRPY